MYSHIYEKYLVKLFNVVRHHGDQISMPSELSYLGILFLLLYCWGTLHSNPFIITEDGSEVQGNREICVDSSYLWGTETAVRFMHRGANKLLCCTGPPILLPERGHETGKVWVRMAHCWIWASLGLDAGWPQSGKFWQPASGMKPETSTSSYGPPTQIHLTSGTPIFSPCHDEAV